MRGKQIAIKTYREEKSSLQVDDALQQGPREANEIFILIGIQKLMRQDLSNLI